MCCMPWCCWPFVDVELEEPPKKEKRYIMVEDGTRFYPTPEPMIAPVYYQNHPAYYYTAPAPVPTPAPAPKPASPKSGHVYWYGSTKEEVDAQNYVVHKTHAKPTPLVPYKPSNEQQFYCREFDGSYTLRTATDVMENLMPGYWKYGDEGHPYFVRTKRN